MRFRVSAKGYRNEVLEEVELEFLEKDKAILSGMSADPSYARESRLSLGKYEGTLRYSKLNAQERFKTKRMK